MRNHRALREPGQARLAALLAATLLAVACGGEPGTSPRQLVLITLDTTRADHLGCYGNPEVRTPAIDAFARESVLFETCTAPSHFTIPSHAPIFTSLHLKDHGVVDNGMVLPELPTFLPRRFQSAGYHTGAIVSSRVLARTVHFDQGFDTYDAPRGNERRAEETTRAALEWIRQRRDQEFFLWLHYFDPHMFYDPPPPYDTMYSGASQERFAELEIENLEWFEGRWKEYLRQSDDPEHYRNLYKGEISYLDEQLGKLFEGMRALGLYDGSLIAMTSDHGENLGDRNRYFVHRGIFDDTVLVPCIFKLRHSTSTGRSRQLASALDLYPTLLALSGLEAGSLVRGRDLRAALRDPDSPPRPRTLFYQGARATGLGVKNAEYTFIRRIPPRGQDRRSRLLRSLYERSDSAQRHDLAAERPEVVEALELQATEFLQDRYPLSYEADQIDDPEHLELLRALGYLN